MPESQNRYVKGSLPEDCRALRARLALSTMAAARAAVSGEAPVPSVMILDAKLRISAFMLHCPQRTSSACSFSGCKLAAPRSSIRRAALATSAPRILSDASQSYLINLCSACRLSSDSENEESSVSPASKGRVTFVAGAQSCVHQEQTLIDELSNPLRLLFADIRLSLCFCRWLRHLHCRAERTLSILGVAPISIGLGTLDCTKRLGSDLLFVIASAAGNNRYAVSPMMDDHSALPTVVRISRRADSV